MTTAVLVLLGILALGILVRILGLESLFSTKEDRIFSSTIVVLRFSVRPIFLSWREHRIKPSERKYLCLRKSSHCHVAAVQRNVN